MKNANRTIGRILQVFGGFQILAGILSLWMVLLTGQGFTPQVPNIDQVDINGTWFIIEIFAAFTVIIGTAMVVNSD